MSVDVLTLVNKVLRKLRETEVTTIDGDTYSELITNLLEETNTEIEEAWDWSDLSVDTSLSIATASNTQVLTGVAAGSEIEYLYDSTNKRYLIQNDAKVDEGLDLNATSSSIPAYYKYIGEDTVTGNMEIEVFPQWTSAATLKIKAKEYKGELVFTTPSTNLLVVPTLPLVLGTYARAVDERGEDDGEAFTKADAKYRSALSVAISREDGRQGSKNSQWYPE